jgi:hypothetical protein
MTHHSDSSVQQAAEDAIRSAAARVMGVDLQPGVLKFSTGAAVRVNGMTRDESVLVEAVARQGKLKGSQQRKVALDAFKLITLARDRPGTRLALVFADDEAAAFALGKGWVADALRIWNVEVLVVRLDDALRARIREAQRDQRDALRTPDGDGGL